MDRPSPPCPCTRVLSPSLPRGGESAFLPTNVPTPHRRERVRGACSDFLGLVVRCGRGDTLLDCFFILDFFFFTCNPQSVLPPLP
jgi:hypothetical protein